MIGLMYSPDVTQEIDRQPSYMLAFLGLHRLIHHQDDGARDRRAHGREPEGSRRPVTPGSLEDLAPSMVR